MDFYETKINVNIYKNWRYFSMMLYALKYAVMAGVTNVQYYLFSPKLPVV